MSKTKQGKKRSTIRKNREKKKRNCATPVFFSLNFFIYSYHISLAKFWIKLHLDILLPNTHLNIIQEFIEAKSKML